MITLIKPKSIDEVNDLLKSQELSDRVSEDGVSEGNRKFKEDSQTIYLVMNGVQKIGYFYIQMESSSCIKVHPGILKKYRVHSKEFGLAVLKWFCIECPKEVKKMVAEIPEIYKDVYFYAKHLGFLDEGINRKSFLKGGEIVDQFILGLTRNEAKKILGGLL